MKDEKDYTFSFNGERFEESFSSIDETIDFVKEEYPDFDYVYIGEAIPFQPEIFGDFIIERIQEQAYDIVGEVAEIYLEGVSDKDVDLLGSMLTETFNKWAKITSNEPNIFEVINVKEYLISDGSRK